MKKIKNNLAIIVSISISILLICSCNNLNKSRNMKRVESDSIYSKITGINFVDNIKKKDSIGEKIYNIYNSCKNSLYNKFTKIPGISHQKSNFNYSFKSNNNGLLKNLFYGTLILPIFFNSCAKAQPFFLEIINGTTNGRGDKTLQINENELLFLGNNILFDEPILSIINKNNGSIIKSINFTIENSDRTIASDIIMDDENNSTFFIAGQTFINEPCVFISSFDYNKFNFTWTNIFLGPEFETGPRIKLTKDGNITLNTVTGSPPISFDTLNLKIRKNGNLIWSIIITRNSGGGASIDIAENGDFLVGAGSNSDISAARIIPNGTLRWGFNYFFGLTTNDIKDIKIDKNDKIYIVGKLRSSVSGPNTTIFNGGYILNLEGNGTFNYAQTSFTNSIYDSLVINDNIKILGLLGTNLLTSIFDKNGTQVQSKTFRSSNRDSLSSITKGDNGTLLITGKTIKNNVNFPLLGKTDINGNIDDCFENVSIEMINVNFTQSPIESRFVDTNMTSVNMTTNQINLKENILCFDQPTLSPTPNPTFNPTKKPIFKPTNKPSLKTSKPNIPTEKIEKDDSDLGYLGYIIPIAIIIAIVCIVILYCIWKNKQKNDIRKYQELDLTQIN